jgi:type IV secretion system protein VirD4
MTADEVRMLNNDYALLFIRGEKAVMDKKYDIKKHPNFRLTVDGGAKPYKRPKPVLEIKGDLDYSPDPKNIEIIES